MSSRCAFSVIDRQLLIVDSPSGDVIWHGPPLGLPVEEVQAIPGTDTAVVLLDYMAQPSGSFENLISVDYQGAVVWRAQLPSGSSTDAYVSFDLEGDQLIAHAWSGHRVILDAATGQIRDSKFTK